MEGEVMNYGAFCTSPNLFPSLLPPGVTPAGNPLLKSDLRPRSPHRRAAEEVFRKPDAMEQSEFQPVFASGNVVDGLWSTAAASCLGFLHLVPFHEESRTNWLSIP